MRLPLHRCSCISTSDSLALCNPQACRICSLVLWWRSTLPWRRTTPALRRSLSLLLWRLRPLTLHRAHVRSVSDILSESADRAGELGHSSVTVERHRFAPGRTYIFVLSSERDDWDEADCEPVPGLNWVRRPVTTVVALRGDSFVALQLARKV